MTTLLIIILLRSFPDRLQMMENLVDIDWADVRQSVPAFITIVTMPVSAAVPSCTC